MKRWDNSGFSVVELILSITVGALFIASLTQITNNYVSLGQKSRNVILSNSYVEGKVETLRNIGYNGLNVGTTDLSSELPAQLPSPRSATMTISNPGSGLKQADISVTYNDKSKVQTYSYTTYIGELSVIQ